MVSRIYNCLPQVALAPCLTTPCRTPCHTLCTAGSSLASRSIENWKECALITGTILAVVSAVFAFFQGFTLYATTLLFLGSLTAMSAFYIPRLNTLQRLETTSRALTVERERLSNAATRLERENGQLTQTNQDLTRTNAAFQVTNQQLTNTNTSLQATNRQLQDTNTQFTRQVALLTLQVTQLQESAGRIRTEVDRFGQQNVALQNTVQVMDRQIETSRALCREIAQQFSDQRQDLGAQIAGLQQHLRDLTSDSGLLGRIRAIESLGQQITAATRQLHEINVQQAEERARLETIRNTLTRLREAYEGLLSQMTSANQTHQSHNQTLSQHIERMGQFLHPLPLAN